MSFEGDATLENIKNLNKILEADLFCCPAYNSINGKWIDECLVKIKEGKGDGVKYHVTKEVINAWRRAYQTTYFYYELDILKPFVRIIDAATISFYYGNWISACLTLAPVIEGVLSSWKDRDAIVIERPSVRELVKKVFMFAESKLDAGKYLHNHLKLQCDFLNKTLDQHFYFRGDKYLKKQGVYGFNRNVLLHMLQIPSEKEGADTFIRLLLILDLIAMLYVHSHPEEHRNLLSCFDLEFNENLLNKYYRLYCGCSNSGLNASYINTLHNEIYKGA